MSSIDAGLIQKHIEQLRSHPHVVQITKIKNLVYKILYWPQHLDSLYAQIEYNLKLTIPEAYPQKPPFLTFLDKIYHLNIHPATGQVSMPILKEDWSPFLNLKAIISSLDQVLEDPDESMAVTKDILEEYQNNLTEYVERVKQTLSMYLKGNKNIDLSQMSNFEKEEVEQVIEMNDLSQQGIKKSSMTRKIYTAEQSMNFLNLGIRPQDKQRKEYSFNQLNQINQSPILEKDSKQFQTKKQLNLIEKGKFFPFNNHKKESIENFRNQTYNKNQSSFSNSKYDILIQDQTKKINDKQKDDSYHDLKIQTIRYKELITIFSAELTELQHNSQNHKSKRLKTLIDDRCSKLQDMIVELFDLSQKARLKLMDNVRKHSVKFQ